MPENEVGVRIKELRKSLGLTQKEFGANIGIIQSVINMLEKGSRIPNERQIILISSYYNISREWLETGEGEMQTKMTADEEISFFIGQILGNDEAPSVLRSFLKILARTTPEEREVLSKIIEKTIADYEGK